MAVEPDRALDGWFADRALTLHHVLEALVAAGKLHERRTLVGTTRFDTASPRRLHADEGADVSRPSTSASPADAAVLAFGSTAHLIGRLRQWGYSVDLPDIADESFIQVGEQEWLIRAGVG